MARFWKERQTDSPFGWTKAPPGYWPVNLMFAELLEIMKENRRKDEEDAGYL